jgi:alkaline phosphatase
MKNIFLLFLLFISKALLSQEYTNSNIHSHNDYASPIPFYEAYAHQIGSIEVDVFLKNNELFVAHTETEIVTTNTLRSLYLKPLVDKIAQLKGYVFKNEKPLLLMIDLKTEAKATLKTVIQQLNEYPQLLSSKAFNIIITGNIPDPYLWNNYPSYIYFDGRPNITYTSEQLKKIGMISTDLKEYTKWNGKGILTKIDHEKIVSVIESVHDKNKKIRFWSTSDNVNTWLTLMKLEVDYIGTDQVSKLASFIANKSKSSFHNKEYYDTYEPKETNTLNEKATPKNIILMIGDGMGLTQIYAGYTANRGKLNMFKIPTIGLSITTASDSYITDSAAGATAMASGYKTNNRFIGVDSLEHSLVSITKKLAQQGYQSAIISSGDITDATPAAFYAHQSDRSFNEAIANDFLVNKSNILIGGGLKFFKNIAKNLLYLMMHQ